MFKSKLIELGIYPHLKGFHYLNDALMLYSQPDLNMGEIRQIIADAHKTTVTSVERDMRYAVKGCNAAHGTKYKVSAFVSTFYYMWLESKDKGSDCFVPEENNPYPLCMGTGEPKCEECQHRAEWEPSDPYGMGV